MAMGNDRSLSQSRAFDAASVRSVMSREANPKCNRNNGKATSEDGLPSPDAEVRGPNFSGQCRPSGCFSGRTLSGRIQEVTEIRFRTCAPGRERSYREAPGEEQQVAGDPSDNRSKPVLTEAAFARTPAGKRADPIGEM